MDFFVVLQGIMDEQGLSVAEVARRCGLPDGTVRSIIVRKQKNVALEVAFKLSAGLGVSLERLNGLPEKDGPQPTPEELAERLTGDTEEDITKDAENLAALTKSKGTPHFEAEGGVMSDVEKYFYDRNKNLDPRTRKENA